MCACIRCKQINFSLLLSTCTRHCQRNHAYDLILMYYCSTIWQDTTEGIIIIIFTVINVQYGELFKRWTIGPMLNTCFFCSLS